MSTADLEKEFGMKNYVLCICSLFSLVSCGGSSDSATSEVNQTPPPTEIQNVTNTRFEVIVNWQPNQSFTYDLYIANEPIESIENYTTYQGAQRFADITPPYEISLATLGDISKVYFFSLVTKSNGLESEPSDERTVLPRYIDGGKQVTDAATGKIWLKCSLGQVWDNNSESCTGEAVRLSNDDAVATLNAMSEGWRLPKIAEIKSIIYCASGEPLHFPWSEDLVCEQNADSSATVYTKAFPNTSNEYNYRTSERWLPEDGGTGNFRIYETISLSTGSLASIHASEPAAYFVKAVKNE